ncbi:hypothetical protein Syun_024139 [Stephania yunnanensis]|uniref:Cysteine-rich receptor-like protein kinase 2 n=1 Tax=Stephania yunnanensis TaxID=152371 RepID=A0AAP0FQ58_9MAGN
MTQVGNQQEFIREMKKTIICVVCPMFVFILLSVQLETVQGDARTQTVELKCDSQREHNTTRFVPNFVATMENISDQMRTKGYGQAVVGTGPDRNYGFAQCYGDLSLLDCVLCYAEARTNLPRCFPFNGGRIYLDGCFMRAENYSFFGEISGAEDKAVCGNASRKNHIFRETARRAVLDAAMTAPGNGGFARAALPVQRSGNESVYVLANCWEVLNASSCKACLEKASSLVMGCLPWSEGRALKAGCFMRYSDMNFLNAEQSGKRSKGSNESKKMAKSLYNSSLNFKYSTLEKATGSFDEANKLGQGGFGTVYKGVLADGREVAVKRLFFNNRHRALDFFNEVNIISSLEHKNLVRLLGCCCSGPESLLVYEFLPNKSLDRFIFDPDKGKALNWYQRIEIIIGTAEGLIHLHENPEIRIIHRDIKASNILLDSKFRAKIADFGLARSFQGDKSHISTAIAGTLGYMAPEYLAHGQLTEKADVYSFGVLLIEIVTGRQSRSKNTDYADSLVISEEQLPSPSNPPFIDEKTMELNGMHEDPSHPLNTDSSPSNATASYSSFYPR